MFHSVCADVPLTQRLVTAHIEKLAILTQVLCIVERIFNVITAFFTITVTVNILEILLLSLASWEVKLR